MSRSLKMATRNLVKDLGGLDGATESCRLSRARLQQCMSDTDSKSYLPIDVVDQLEAQVSMPRVTKALADNRGMRFVPIADFGTINSVEADFLVSARRFSEFVVEYEVSLANEGFINPKEAEKIMTRLTDMQEAILRMKRNMMSIVDSRP